MSGLEALAALGLACNIVQLVESAGSAFKVAKSIVETGSPDPSLSKIAIQLSMISDEVNSSMQSSSRPLEKDQQELRSVAKGCLDVAKELSAELSKLAGDASGGKLRTALTTLKVMMRRSSIEKLESRMFKYQTVLETRILFRMSKQQDLLLVQSQSSFNEINKTLQTFIQNLTHGQTTVTDLVSRESKSVKDHVTAESHSTREDIITELSAIESQRSRKEELKHFLESLSYKTMNERRNHVKGTHHGTYDWIFRSSSGCDERNSENTQPNGSDAGDLLDDDTEYSNEKKPSWDSFPEWLKSSDEKVYWISGKPGSGKSTLLKFIIEHHQLRETLISISPDPMVISHFLWNAGQRIQKSYKGCLSALLFQLVENTPSTYDKLKLIFPDLSRKRSLGDWSEQELSSALLTACKDCPRAIYIFIDGLDEIISDDTSRPLRLIEDLSALSGVKLCVSSRPEPIFIRQLSRHKHLRMQDLTLRDVQQYCRDHLMAIFQEEEMFARIMDTICHKADGIFLWVVLVVKSLERGAINMDSPQIMEERLGKLPSDLFALYKDMWSRLNDDMDVYRARAATYLNMLLVLNWLLNIGATEQQLEVVVLSEDRELAEHSITLEAWPGSGDIVYQRMQETANRLQVQCAGLIEVTSEGFARLIHRSAIEFLQETPEGSEILKHDTRTWNEHLYMHCLATMAAQVRSAVDPCDPSRTLNSLKEAIRTLVNRSIWLRRLPSVQIDEIAGRMAWAYRRIWNICITLDRTSLTTNLALGWTVPLDMWDFNGILIAYGSAERLAALLVSHSSNPMSPEYLLYLLDCFCDHSTVGRGETTIHGQLDLLLAHGMSLTSQRVRISTCGTNQKISFKRTALGMIFEACGATPLLGYTDMFEKLIDGGSNPHEKVLLSLISRARSRANEKEIWTVSPITAETLFRFCGVDSKESTILLEVELTFALKLFAARLFTHEFGNIDALKRAQLWKKLMPYVDRPRVLAFGQPWKSLQWPTEDQETQILDCIMENTCDGIADGKIYSAIMRSSFPGLRTCVEEMEPPSVDLSESAFIDGLNDHVVRRRDSILPPLPPNIFTVNED